MKANWVNRVIYHATPLAAMFPTCALAFVVCAAASLPGENPRPHGKIGKPWSMTTPENCPCGRGHSGKCFLG